jgi:hypothetical protein
MKSAPASPRILLAVLLQTAVAIPSSAADKRYPDWPCMQLKVPELSPAAVWSGPPLPQGADAVSPSAGLSDLISKLSARRTALEEARTEIAAFLTGSVTERQAKATQLFSGLFGNLNRERNAVMNALERFSRKQKRLAQSIRDNTLKLRELQDQPNPDDAAVQALAQQVEWDTRVFEDRRKSTSFLCEVPVIIEQRLFALGRFVQEAIN